MEVCYAEQGSNSIGQFGTHSKEGAHIVSEQVVWPIHPKPIEVVPKVEPENQQSLPFVDANDALHSALDSADFASLQTDTPIEKCKVRKRRLTSEDGDAVDADTSGEKQSIMRWKDEWVSQLIHIKGRAQSVLSGPQKQRVDLWQVIKSEMARTCLGFDKDSEACRKKWRRVYKEYKDDKCLRAAGNGLQKCKFYDLMDFYMGERTSGVNISQLTAIGYNDSHLVSPAKREQVSAMGEELAVAEAYDASQSSARFCMPGVGQPRSVTGDTHAAKRPYRRGNSHVGSDDLAANAAASGSLSSLLAEFVGLGKEMINIARRYEQETVDVLHSMKEALTEISKQI